VKRQNRINTILVISIIVGGFLLTVVGLVVGYKGSLPINPDSLRKIECNLKEVKYDETGSKFYLLCDSSHVYVTSRMTNPLLMNSKGEINLELVFEFTFIPDNDLSKDREGYFRRKIISLKNGNNIIYELEDYVEVNQSNSVAGYILGTCMFACSLFLIWMLIYKKEYL
jgi:hypothetical protein